MKLKATQTVNMRIFDVVYALQEGQTYEFNAEQMRKIPNGYFEQLSEKVVEEESVNHKKKRKGD